MLTAALFAVLATVFIEAVAAGNRGQVGRWLMSGWPPIVNVLLFGAVWLIVGALTGEARGAAVMTLVFLSGLALASAMKVAARQQPLLPPDLRLISEAWTVFSVARLPFTAQSGLLPVAAVAVLLPLAFTLPATRWPFTFRVAAFVGALGALLSVVYYRRVQVLWKLAKYADELSPRYNYAWKGFLLGFVLTVDLTMIRTPPGYGPAAVAAIASQLTPEPAPSRPSRAPVSLIIVLGESFIDPNRLAGVRFTSDPAPTFHHLAETFGRIDLVTPVFGGGSCNAEFEMLCGGNMLFLPTGSYPYVQFIDRPTPSVASILRSRGYATAFLHPLPSSFYNTGLAVSHLGFAQFRGIDRWTHKATAGLYVSDAAAAEELIDEIGRLEPPYFVVLNTMEAHDPYTPGRYGSEDGGIASAPSGSEGVLATYVTAIRHTDAALKRVVEHLEKQDNPVMVVFYGDHLPRLSDDEPAFGAALAQLGVSGGVHSLEARTTAAVFWTNTDRRFETARTPVGMCYFSPLVLECLGHELPPLQIFLNRLRRRYPVLSLSGCLDEHGRQVAFERVMRDPDVEHYRLLNYDLLRGGQFLWKGASSARDASSNVSAPLVLKAIHPSTARAGVGFNTQADGESALGIEADESTPTTAIYFDGRKLRSTHWSPASMSAIVPERMIRKPGAYDVKLVDGFRESNTLQLIITP